MLSLQKKQEWMVADKMQDIVAMSELNSERLDRAPELFEIAGQIVLNNATFKSDPRLIVG